MGRRFAVPMAAALLILMLSATCQATVLKFDFGRSDRPQVMEGFTPVTVRSDYDEAKGYGWVGVSGPAKADWLEERSPLVGCLRTQAPDDLSADYVAGGGEFDVKLPDGAYVVWAMVGDWGAYEFYPRGKYSVLAQGQVIGGLDHLTYEIHQGRPLAAPRRRVRQRRRPLREVRRVPLPHLPGRGRSHRRPAQVPGPPRRRPRRLRRPAQRPRRLPRRGEGGGGGGTAQGQGRPQGPVREALQVPRRVGVLRRRRHRGGGRPRLLRLGRPLRRSPSAWPTACPTSAPVPP